MRLAFLLLASCCAAFAQVPMPPPQVPSGAKPAARPPARRAGRAPAAPGRGAAAASYKDLAYSAPRLPEPPPITRAQLSNGIKVLLVEDHGAPMIYGAALVRTGAAFDPPGRAGLAGITGSLIRSGGTRLLDAGRFDSQAEDLGAVLESSIGEDAGTVSFSVLRNNLAPALSLFRDLLTAPGFRADRLDAAKAAAFNAIARRNDDPRQVLRREFFRAAWGKDSPLVRRPEYDDIAAIGRADVERFYRRYFFPANTILVVCGDFDSGQMKGALDALFSDWKNDQDAVPELPKTAPAPAPGTYLASKPELRDTFVAFGRLGATYRDRDAAALAVAAAILGGGPRSRLGKRRDALSAVSEALAEAPPGLANPGSIAVTSVSTPGAAADEVQAAIDEMRKLRSAEPTADEVRIAREWLWLRACEGLDNRWRAAFLEATAEYHGYPADYLRQYLTAVAAVTPADVLRVSREWLDPAKFTLAAVSNWRTFPDPRGLPVTAVDLTIPPSHIQSSTATAASTEQGKKLLARAREAAGGAEKLAAVQDYSMKTSYNLVDGGRDIEFDQWVAPSILRQDGDSTRFGRLIRFTDGSGGWISNGYGSAPIPAQLLRQAQSDLLRGFFSLLLSDRISGRAISALDGETVEISQGEASVRVAFDPATGLPSELHYSLANNQGMPVLAQEHLSDYRDVNGIKLPFAVTVFQNGRKFADGVVSEIKLNQGLKPEVLQRRP